MRILIVEDDFISRQIIRGIISPYGKTDIAVDGHEAMEGFVNAWAQKEPYDLVFMDIMMPGIDGKEALSRIRDMEKDMGVKPGKEVKVIMLTALDDPKTVIESFLKSGATSYMVKPIDKDGILNEVRELGLID
ncbi:MAG: response regulator [Thermodesulfobacteriota bacterium]|nr:response regulator [Thermodesulfobacteriota bacterium]